MSLESRQRRFQDMCSRFSCKMADPLLAQHYIAPDLYSDLEIAVMMYVSRSLPRRRIISNEIALMSTIEEVVARSGWGAIKNRTPNGMLVPKRHLILEYNAVVRAYARIMEWLNISDFISTFHVPLNVRLKEGIVSEENLQRGRQTEHMHTDSWAGESSESVTTMIPLFGDTERNLVRYFAPPPDFEEDWIHPLPSYQAGADIAKRYTPIHAEYAKRHIYLVDFGTIHASTHLRGAQPRISIDTTFAFPTPNEKIHPWREGERMSYHDLCSIGTEKLFVFPQTEDEQVDSQGGFKHPSNLYLTTLIEG